MANPRELLEKLGAVLQSEGFRTRVALEDPPLLHVAYPGLPVLQETIGCGVNQGELWFRWVTQEVLLGRADDIAGAAQRVMYVLSPDSADDY